MRQKESDGLVYDLGGYQSREGRQPVWDSRSDHRRKLSLTELARVRMSEGDLLAAFELVRKRGLPEALMRAPAELMFRFLTRPEK